MDLQIFKNEMFKVSIQLEDGEILFDAENVARCLGFTQIKNNKEYIRWATVNRYIGKYVSQEVGKGDFVPEPLVYKLAFKANNEVAEKFQDWLAMEVIPQIRKHGMYAKDELLDNPDLLLDVVKKYKEEREQKLLLENKIALDKLKVLFAEAVENSEDVILVKEMALILTQHGFKVGQNQLFEYLRKYEYLCKKLGDMYNLPTKKYEHLFKVTKRVMQGTKGAFTTNTPKITDRGQMYFVKKFAEYKLSGLTIKDLLVDKSIAL